MILASFAQNQEDVMLWRALRDVEQGFYVDVGAADPSAMSVTRLFHEHGWRGINIEPDRAHFAALAAARPGDVNLRLCVDRAPGSKVFHVIPGSGLSTLDDGLAAAHAAAGWTVADETVRCLPLAEILRAHHPEGEIHFLKIDAEGAERDVLLGMDFGTFRPWIVLLEATRTNSPEPNHQNWEGILFGADYRFAWFDGLNRFYVASEHFEALSPHFRVQPNVFDGFAESWSLLRRAEQAEQRAAEIDVRLAAAETERVVFTAQLAQLNQSLRDMVAERDSLWTRAVNAEAAARAADAAHRAALDALGGAGLGRREAEDLAERREQALGEQVRAVEVARDEALGRAEAAEARANEAEVARDAVFGRAYEAEARAERAGAAEASFDVALAHAGAARDDAMTRLGACECRTHELEADAARLVWERDAVLAALRAEEDYADNAVELLRIEAGRAETLNSDLSRITAERDGLRAALCETEQRFGDVLAGKQHLVQLAAAMRDSTSWRLTRPLRVPVRVMRGELRLRDLVGTGRRHPVSGVPAPVAAPSPPEVVPAVIVNVLPQCGCGSAAHPPERLRFSLPPYIAPPTTSPVSTSAAPVAAAAVVESSPEETCGEESRVMRVLCAAARLGAEA